jgi:hypothetical protein
MNELRETTVNIRLMGDDIPTVENARGYKFTPETLHMLWTKYNADDWSLTYVELKGKLADKPVNKTFMCDVRELPEWLRYFVALTTPIEVLTERVS